MRTVDNWPLGQHPPVAQPNRDTFVGYTVAICLFGGYFFGNLAFVKENFSVVILAIIFISILPGVYEFARHKAEERRKRAALLAATDAPK